ncbi:MAG: chemotaxis protein CheW [Anaerolineae bacterium]|jgi:purine-binding chemotaxis protein CheW|nr:chemotaxis protein CheW [Anaerolineae bacterium]
MSDFDQPLTTIDWQALLAQLNPEDPAQQQQALAERLQQRAKNYAAGTTSYRVLSEEDVYHVLTFSLGTERYAVDVAAVRGVRHLTRLTRVPGVPPFYRGVVNVRGQISSVVDLRFFFNIIVVQDDAPDELILVEAAGLQVALVAHHIEDVMTIPTIAVEPVEMHYARGVTLGRMVVLDIEQLLSDERLMMGGGDDHAGS